MPACRACGALAPDDARFCPTCGSALGGAPRAPGAPSPSPAPPEAYAPEPAGATLPAASRPLGVTVLGLWSMVAGPVFALVGLAVLAVGPALLADPQFQGQLEQQFGTQVPQDLLAAMVTLVGSLLLLDGLLTAVAGYGFYQRFPWGWGAMLGAGALWGLTGVLMLPAGLLFLVPAGAVLWYLTRPGVKHWFGKARPEEFGMPGYVPPPAPPNHGRTYHDRIHPERVAGCPDCEARAQPVRGPPGAPPWGPPGSP